MHNSYSPSLFCQLLPSLAFFLQTLIFHPQTKLGAFQDTFSVSLACIKSEMLLCIYVICNENNDSKHLDSFKD